MNTLCFSRAVRSLAAGLLLSSLAGAQDPTEPRAPHEGGGCEVVTVLDYGLPPAPTPAGAPLALSVTFDPNVTNAQRAVCQQAVAEWQAAVESNGQIVVPYPIHFENGPLGGNVMARATTSSNPSTGVLLSSVIRIDDDGTSVFFVDPTPNESSEFDSTGTCIDPSVCGNVDLLTVLRHELGHSIGWTGFFPGGGFPANPIPAPLMSGATFDPSRLNVPCDPALTSHSSATAFPGTLMNPTLIAGTRIGIADYPDLAVIGRAYQCGVRLRFVDSTATGSQSGTATNPYFSVKAVEEKAPPAGLPIVVANGTYLDSPLILKSAHLYTCAWNGAAVIQ